MQKITGIIFVSMLISLSLYACNTKDEISNKTQQINDYQGFFHFDDLLLINDSCFLLSDDGSYSTIDMPDFLMQFWKENMGNYYQWEDNIIIIPNYGDKKISFFNVNTHDKNTLKFENGLYFNNSNFLVNGKIFFIEIITDENNEELNNLWCYDLNKDELNILLENKKIGQYTVGTDESIYYYEIRDGFDTLCYFDKNESKVIKKWKKDAWIELKGCNQKGLFIIKENFDKSEHLLWLITKEGTEYRLAGSYANGTEAIHLNLLLGNLWFFEDFILWDNSEDNSLAAFNYSLNTINEYKRPQNDNEKCIKIINNEKTIHSYLLDEKKNSVRIDSFNSMSLANQTYDSFLDFPYNEMVFVNQETFHILKQTYEEIDFWGEFKKGNLKAYDVYINEYKKLLENEVSFTQKNMHKEMYLNEYLGLDDKNQESLEDYTFYYFDIDEDETPELCLSDNNSIYVFKYISKEDKMILWHELNSGYYQLNGSKTFRWNNGGLSHGFYKLNSNGEEIYYLFFFLREDYNKNIEQAEVVYMVSLPHFTNEADKIEGTEEILNQGYFDQGQDVYYFRVTEEQFDELTEDYFVAEKLALENIEEVSYSYKELLLLDEIIEVGSYSFYEFAPPNQNMNYLITIEQEDDLYAYIKIDGFQTLLRMKAKVLSSNDEIILEFYEHYVDEVGNTSMWEVCSKGDILLTLKRKNDILITEWREIQPLLIANEEPGQYFTKVIE